jgi:hypothetical protein
MCWIATAVSTPCFLEAQGAPSQAPQRPPKPIEPPHKPAQQGFRLTATIGFGLIANGNYRYSTTVTMPDGTSLAYNGVQRTAGATLFLGAAATPVGAFRRLTLGFDLNFGGLDVAGHSVVPPGSVTPFSQTNLNAQVAQKSLLSSSWHPFFSPYVEHAIGSILQNRIRLGYEYFRSAGSSNGLFAIDQSGNNQARYSVQFSQASHMIRVSVHNDSWFDEPDTDRTAPRRRSGVVQQAAVLFGTDGSVVVALSLGPVWTF